MPERDTEISRFLETAGWGGATRAPLAGDASARRYWRLALGEAPAVLMDAPPGSGEDVRPFVAIARHLAGLGFSAPAILAEDAGKGLLLLEDLGDDLFARVVAHAPEAEPALYAAATDLLAQLHRAAPPEGVPPYGPDEMTGLSGLVFEWYLPAATGAAAPAAPQHPCLAQLHAALAAHAPETTVLVLRDYHAENLLWLPGRSDHARVGLLDFQDGARGHPGYDLVSLLEDARRDVAPALRAEMMARYATATGQDPAAFATACAVLSAQRNLRILGIFARLCLRDGKPGYIELMPRVWGYLLDDLAHPSLADLRASLLAVLPEPTLTIRERIRARCAITPGH